MSVSEIDMKGLKFKLESILINHHFVLALRQESYQAFVTIFLNGKEKENDKN